MRRRVSGNVPAAAARPGRPATCAEKSFPARSHATVYFLPHPPRPPVSTSGPLGPSRWAFGPLASATNLFCEDAYIGIAHPGEALLCVVPGTRLELLKEADHAHGAQLAMKGAQALTTNLVQSHRLSAHVCLASLAHRRGSSLARAAGSCAVTRPSRCGPFVVGPAPNQYLAATNGDSTMRPAALSSALLTAAWRMIRPSRWGRHESRENRGISYLAT